MSDRDLPVFCLLRNRDSANKRRQAFTLIELLFFCLNVFCGYLLGRYGYSLGGIWLGVLFFIAGMAGFPLTVELLATLGEKNHRHKLASTTICSCGATALDPTVTGRVGTDLAYRCKCRKLYRRTSATNFVELASEEDLDDIFDA